MILVTLDVGPRVISYRLKDGKNVLFNDLERKCVEKGPEFDQCFYPGAAWYTYGGHRLWISPEIYPTTYYPENDPVEYRVEGNRVTFLPPLQKYTYMQMTTSLTLDENSSKVKVEHSIQNCYKLPITLSPWAITVMAPGGVEIIPMPDRKTGYLSNRVLSLWDYSNMADPRVTWGKEFITLKQDTAAETPFKLGINNEHGWAAYLLDGVAFIKRYTHDGSVTYPDNNVSYESYTCDKFLEMETVGELKEVQPGETVYLEENWELRPQEPFCTCDLEKMRAFAASL